MQASGDAASAGAHTPVLYQNVLSHLNLRSGGHYIDGTVGAGGHAAGILEGCSPDGRLLGLDRDREALALAGERLAAFSDRVVLKQTSFTAMENAASTLGWASVDGVLLDLGLSSMQLDQPQRGFSFLREGPLDMRFDTRQSLSAAELVNSLPEDDLQQLLWRFGEEPRARRISRAIAAARPLHTTTQLAEVIASVSGQRRGRVHPATRTFQALRIAVNEELDQLERGLEAALALLRPGGRLAVIAFHSLEDRIVKNFMRDESRDCLCPPEAPFCTCGHTSRIHLVTRRPIKPDEDEIERNPRARSARLRVAEARSLA